MGAENHTIVAAGEVTEFKLFTESTAPDLMLASTSQILTAPPTAGKVETGLAGSKERLVLTCARCDYKSFHKHALDRHVQAVHDKVKLYQCARCDYKTGHASALKRHESKVHEKNQQMIFACEACDYHTVHKSALKRHTANRHEKESQTVHQCSVCEYKTTYEFALERHISTVHLKEGAFECSLCEYNTVHKHALDRHTKMVHEKPPHLSCDICDYKSAHKSALRMHYATVHECKATFKCDKCNYETLYKTALHRHQTTVMCSQGEKVGGAASLNRQSQNNLHRRLVEQQQQAVPDSHYSPLEPGTEVCVEQVVPANTETLGVDQQIVILQQPAGVLGKTRTDLGSLSNETFTIQKLDTTGQQMIPVNLGTIGTITMIERGGVLHPVSTIQLAGAEQGESAAASYYTLAGDLVQLVRTDLARPGLQEQHNSITGP